MSDGSFIVDVTIRALAVNGDFRGSLYEIHRDEWRLAPRPVQWDLVTSKTGALRGVQFHCLRWDYVIVLEGRATIGLKDIRPDKQSFGRSQLIEVNGQQPVVVTIPPGVAHGIFASSAMRHLYGLTVPWDGSDEDLGCRYDDPALAMRWPSEAPFVLPRDLAPPDFATMSRQYATVAHTAAPMANTST